MFVYDILGDFWSLFMTTLVAIQNHLGQYISLRALLVVTYEILGDFVFFVYDNICGYQK